MRTASEPERPSASGHQKEASAPGAQRQNITVAVRVRPLTTAEKARSAWATVDVVDTKHVQVNDPDDKMGGIDYLRLGTCKTKNYAFDVAFGPTSTQAEVYEATAKPLARKAVEGYNACCFAYGATGAGKVYQEHTKTLADTDRQYQSITGTLLPTCCLLPATADVHDDGLARGDGRHPADARGPRAADGRGRRVRVQDLDELHRDL